ncbi:MAG: hypothetical protein ACUVWZ_03545 [Anaerolineae bacterium]
MEAITLSLLITVVGVGLVFGAIVLFWLLMLALVWMTGSLSSGPAEGKTASPTEATDQELRRKAALAAVAVALSLEGQEQPRLFPLPPTALVSTWQAVMRSKLLGQRGAVR